MSRGSWIIALLLLAGYSERFSMMKSFHLFVNEYVQLSNLIMSKAAVDGLFIPLSAPHWKFLFCCYLHGFWIVQLLASLFFLGFSLAGLEAFFSAKVWELGPSTCLLKCLLSYSASWPRTCKRVLLPYRLSEWLTLHKTFRICSWSDPICILGICSVPLLPHRPWSLTI